MIAQKDFLHDDHSQHDTCCAQDGGFSRRFYDEDDVTIKTIFSRCMPVLAPEPSQEGRLWDTRRVPVGGAAISSDVRTSSC
ncbi:hypothetical protein AVEN_143861-1 [Araneus ventricosus]|uniref:Uncharacterized protein n=1 Tax=Araneus ventricosus TaxID=182803 RepID=A0A4Y2SEL2_ARAVE|nr:hypothetical protein AVEN_69028-1 [Araneus ventricosus]GBN86673.1 hypothetical protein AVEN_143861-1 [Araneus ventricosus]